MISQIHSVCMLRTIQHSSLKCISSPDVYSADTADNNIRVGDCGQGHGRERGGPDRNSHSHHCHHRQEWPWPRVHTTTGEKQHFLFSPFSILVHFLFIRPVTYCSDSRRKNVFVYPVREVKGQGWWEPVDKLHLTLNTSTKAQLLEWALNGELVCTKKYSVRFGSTNNKLERCVKLLSLIYWWHEDFV